jgi:anti-sigma factor RsiW
MSQRVESDRCAEVLDRLESWIDGDLDQTQAAAMQSHIDGCASCRRERQLAEELVAELRAMPDFEIPERVLDAVHRKTRPGVVEKIRSIFERDLRRPLPAMATAAAVLLLVVVISPWDRKSAPEYSDQDVSRAAAELRLAFAYVGDITRRAEVRVKEKLIEDSVASQTMRGVRRSFRIIGEVGTTAAGPAATPQPTVKGS